MNMTPDEHALAVKLIWDDKVGPSITTDLELSELLAEDLRKVGVNIIRVGRKPRSRNKFIVFDIEIVCILGFDISFLTEKEAQDWHNAKNRSISTLSKAPDLAFEPVKTGKRVETLWWSQAFNICYRLGGVNLCKEKILIKRGKAAGMKYGL
jgi:hypothetical protein